MTNTLPHDHQLQQKHEQAPVVAHKPQMMKKQTRRRTHASRPYQERLLNMAEARQEIVTALKIHRANMRQQPTYQHQESTLLRRSPSPLQLRQQQEQQQPQQQVVFRQDRSQAAVEEAAAPPAPTSYAAAASFADHQLCNPLAQWIAAAAPSGAGSYCYSSPVLLPYDLTPLEAPTAAMGGVDVEWHGLEHLARSFPAQPLGLNLSFHGFGGGFVDAANDSEDLFGGAPLIQSSSSPAASSHAAYSPIATAEVASGTLGSPALSSTAEKYSSSIDAPAAALIPVAPDDGETRPVGEAQGGVGLCEAATAADVSAASAWWSKILLESVGESGGEVVEGGAAVGCTAEDVASSSAAAGLPAEWRRWLCDDGAGEQGAVTGADKPPPDVVLETMHAADGDYNNCCYQGGHRSDGGADDGITALPCLDDIEGWDGEWFSCSS